MTTYTVTKESQERTHQALSEAFNIPYSEVLFEEYVAETIPRNSVSISLPGELNPMYGKPRLDLIAYNKARIGTTLSDEWKRNIGDSVSGAKNGMYGKTHTVESRQKISESGCNKEKWLGKTHTVESRQKMRKPKNHGDKIREIALNRPKMQCFCGKVVDKLNYLRWHGDKCKMNPEGFVV